MHELKLRDDILNELAYEPIVDPAYIGVASDEKTSDDEIAKRAINVLSWDSVVPNNAIQITVRDGLVTLTGKVNWYYQKSSAERDVR